MTRLSTVFAIARMDLLRLLRDRFLLGAGSYILACALALRWLVPWMQAELLRANGFDLSPWVPLGTSYFVVVNSSVLTGILGGFLLLETREERTIHAMRVTPTPLAAPLGVLGTAIFVAGAVSTMALSAAVGVGVPQASAVVTAALLGAPTGVVMAWLLASTASNKVEAFAVMKILSFLGMVPVAAYFLPEPVQWAAGVTPIYWACKVWWMAAEGDPSWPWLAGPGVVVSAAWILFFSRRFLRVVHH